MDFSMFSKVEVFHATRPVRRRYFFDRGEFAIARGALQGVGKTAERKPGSLLRRRSRKILLRDMQFERLHAGEMS